MLTHNTPAAFTEHRRRVPFRPSQGNPIGDMLKANAAIHVADLARDERYTSRNAIRKSPFFLDRLAIRQLAWKSGTNSLL
jgi:hypothetical protein